MDHPERWEWRPRSNNASAPRWAIPLENSSVEITALLQRCSAARETLRRAASYAESETLSVSSWRRLCVRSERKIVRGFGLELLRTGFGILSREGSKRRLIRTRFFAVVQ